MLVAVCLLSLLISIPGFVNKAGYGLKGLIPGYNLYLFLVSIEFPPILLMIMSLGLIFLEDRMYVATLFCVLLPFVTASSYNKGFFTGLFTLFLPFFGYPLLAYFIGFYSNDISEKRYPYFKDNWFFCILLSIFSLYVYGNYTILIEDNKLIDKSSEHYVNDIYMSDGRIYNDHLNDVEKKVYMFLLDNFKKYNLSEEVKLSDFGCSDYETCSSAFYNANYALYVDHPEIINCNSFRWKYDRQETITFYFECAVKNKFLTQFSEIKIRRVIDYIKRKTENMSDKEKIKFVYTWLGTHKNYDNVFTFDSENQTIYSVFMENNSVCAGFAKASQVIFQNIGIKSYGIIGVTSGLHMWNVIELDGKYYFYDSTFAGSRNIKSGSGFYDGLRQDKMSNYTMSYPSWYPKIEETNGLLE